MKKTTTKIELQYCNLNLKNIQVQKNEKFKKKLGKPDTSQK